MTRMTEDEMVRWHHGLKGSKFEQTPGDGEGQGTLVGCSPWGHKRVGHDLVTKRHQNVAHAVWCPARRKGSTKSNYSENILMMRRGREYEGKVKKDMKEKSIY